MSASDPSSPHPASSPHPGRPGLARLRALAPRVAKPIGWILTGASLAYIGYLLSHQDLGAKLALLSPLALGLCVLLQVGVCLFQAQGWHALLARGATPGARPPLSSYGRFVLAKYLPGNVWHFLLRQVELPKLGHDQKSIALASFREILGMAGASCLMIALAGLVPDGRVHAIASDVVGPTLGWILPAPVALAGALTLRKLGVPFRVMGFHLAFFALFEAYGAIIVTSIVPDLPALAMAGVLSAAWLVGFVVIGAPGGVGVREAVLVLLAAPMVTQGDMVVAGAALRVVTTLGDLLFAGAVILPPRFLPGRRGRRSARADPRPRG
jgi:hypothetical protein